MSLWSRLLAHPLTAGRALDDVQTTVLRRRVIASKPFLQQLYREWYQTLAASLPPGAGRVLEIGSGAGFLREVVPDLITSDVQPLPGVERTLDAEQLPFAAGELKAILMIDVLHHLRQPARFLEEAARVVRPGGIVGMIEPWVTPWSRLVYAHLHPEPFDPEASWEVDGDGPLSRANGALPWILFARDRDRFARQEREWTIATIRPLMPVAYLLAGGVSLRLSLPGQSYPLVRRLERLLGRATEKTAMFAHIVLERSAPR
ncbi:MAG: class I SAM-dependent methyltransferase [Deltaproteobacteria bacterium]|nr:class I SAM-dependent methyltransferase [Deltaproteobacteria bacterium]